MRKTATATAAHVSTKPALIAQANFTAPEPFADFMRMRSRETYLCAISGPPDGTPGRGPKSEKSYYRETSRMNRYVPGTNPRKPAVKPEPTLFTETYRGRKISAATIQEFVAARREIDRFWSRKIYDALDAKARADVLAEEQFLIASTFANTRPDKTTCSLSQAGKLVRANTPKASKAARS